MDVPLDRCYWVVPGRLLAGEHPASRDEAHTRARLAALIRSGMRCFVDLTCDDERSYTGRYDLLLEKVASETGIDARRESHPIPDMTAPGPDDMARILDAVDGSLGRGEAVYVHCLMGIGRTGAVVGCWLVRHGIASPAEALDCLASLRGDQPSSLLRSPVTDDQCDLVRSWNRGL